MNEMLSLEKQKTQSGQATVEYVLLLAIGAALILGLANQLIKPFGNWMQNYMGQYLECLIDMGELPTVGGSGASGECNSQFSKFTAQNGRPPISSNNNGNNGSGGGRNGGNPNGGNRDSQANGRGGTNGSSGTSSGGGSATDGGGGSSSVGRSRGRPIGSRGGADTPTSGLPEGAVVQKLPESKFFKSKSSSSSIASSNRQNSDSDGGIQYVPIREDQRKKDEMPANSTVKVDSDDMTKSKSKRLIVKPHERKIAMEEDEEPWSFSKYLKYAVILAIVVALVLFIGGQFAQISKSMEK